MTYRRCRAASGYGPHQTEIADCFTDPKIERITLMKPARCGFSTLFDGRRGLLRDRRSQPDPLRAGGSLKVVAARAPRFAEITWACIEWPDGEPRRLALPEQRRVRARKGQVRHGHRRRVAADAARDQRACRIPLLGAVAAGERIVGPPGRGIPRRPQRSSSERLRNYLPTLSTRNKSN
jgi:hypothetical protein